MKGIIMKNLLEKLQSYDNQIKMLSTRPEKPFHQLEADINRLEKLIYFLAKELSK
jgi:hypothetical protein